MSHDLGEPERKSDNGGFTSQGAARAGGLPVELAGREKEIESSVMQPQTSGKDTSTNTNRQTVAKSTPAIDGSDHIYSIAFLKEGKHILSGGVGGMMQQWRLADGKKVEAAMNTGRWVHNMVVSRDRKWIVSGSDRGVSVWSAESHKRVGKIKGHRENVNAVDISPDGTRIASGSSDKTACIWLRRTSKQLLTLSHDNWVVAVKFSPDGRLLATATWVYVRIYDSEDGRLLFQFPINVGSDLNQALAWNDDKRLYAISYDGRIHCLELATGPGKTPVLSQWPIRTDGAQKRGCITLSGNHKFLATSASSSVSFWDTVTCRKVGPGIECYNMIQAMAISENYDIAIGQGNTITIRNLGDILPSEYLPDPTDIDSAESITSLPIQTEQLSKSVSKIETGVEELMNQLVILRGSYEKQSHELTSAQKELETLKSTIEAKDKEIDALAAEVDHWKRAEAVKTGELAVANKELEQRRRDSKELIVVREELQFSKSQTIAVRDWYDDQFRRLRSIVEERQSTPFLVHNFISQADACAEMNIIEMLERLNESIQRSATFITDRVIHDFQPPMMNPTEEQLSITKRIADTIGQPLVNRLRSSSLTEVVAYLPVALHAYLIYYLHDIISSWSVDSGPNWLIRELYNIIRKIESQTTSGRWRSLTYASLSPTCSSNPERFISSMIDGLSDIVFVAGCATSTSAAKEMITSKFRGRISLILTTTGQLTKSIMDALSADYRVKTVRPTVMFDDQIMEADSIGRGIQSRTHRVLCTTQLGLSKEVVTQFGTGPNKKNALTATNVVKVKVLLG